MSKDPLGPTAWLIGLIPFAGLAFILFILVTVILGWSDACPQNLC